MSVNRKRAARRRRKARRKARIAEAIALVTEWGVQNGTRTELERFRVRFLTWTGRWTGNTPNAQSLVREVDV